MRTEGLPVQTPALLGGTGALSPERWRVRGGTVDPECGTLGRHLLCVVLSCQTRTPARVKGWFLLWTQSWPQEWSSVGLGRGHDPQG